MSMEKPTLGAYTLSDFRDGIMTDENWLSSLERFPYEALTEEQKLEYDTLRSLLKTELKSSEVLEYSECLGPTTGIQAQLPLILAEYHFWDRQDIEDYLALLRQIPDYFAQIIDFEKMEIGEEAVYERCDLSGDHKAVQGLYCGTKGELSAGLLFEMGIASVKGVSEEERAEYIRQNEAAVSECVIPAYQSLISALEQLKGTRQ